MIIGDALVKLQLAGKQAFNNDMTDVENTMRRKVRSTIDTLGKFALASAASLALASGKMLVDLQESNKKITAVTEATGGSQTELGELIHKLAEDTAADYDGIQESVIALHQSLGDNEEEIERNATKMALLARATDDDLGQATRDTIELLRLFNEDVTGTGDLYEHLTYLANKYGVEQDYITGKLKNSAEEFQLLGLSAEDSATLIARMGAAGSDAEGFISKLADRVRGMTNRTVDGNAAWENLQGVLESNATDTEKLDALYRVFGNDAFWLWERLKDGKLTLSDLGKDLEESTGYAEQLGDQTLTLGDVWNKFMNTFRRTSGEGVSSLDLLTQGLSFLVDALSYDYDALAMSAFDAAADNIQRAWSWLGSIEARANTWLVDADLLERNVLGIGSAFRFLEDTGTSAADALSNAWDASVGKISGWLDSLHDSLQNVLNLMGRVSNSAPIQGVQGAFGAASGATSSAVSNVFNGDIIDGGTDLVEGTLDKLTFWGNDGS